MPLAQVSRQEALVESADADKENLCISLWRQIGNIIFNKIKISCKYLFSNIFL